MDKVQTPARVTQRCARDDLTDDWDDAADLRLARSDEFGKAKPVHSLRHKLVQKAVDDFPTEGDLDKKRESITGLTNPPFWKVKVDRWRGAVYIDPKSGQAWLVAAGRRYGGEAKDFYKHFMLEVGSRGATYFLPSSSDLILRDEEISERRLIERERHISALSVRLLAEALATKEHYARADLHLDPTQDESDLLGSVELLVELADPGENEPHSVLLELSHSSWSYPVVFAWYEQVMLAALCPQEDRWGTTQTDVRMHSLEVPTSSELQAMARGDVAADPIGHFAPGSTSHTVHKARLTQDTIEGEPVQGVCGRWFVPRQDHEGKPQCGTCLTLMQTLDIQLAPPSE